MVSVFRQQSPLPWRSPHPQPGKFDSFPFPTTLTPTILSSLRARPVALALLALLSTFALLSYAPPLTSIYSSSFDPHSSPFSPKGLSKKLFNELDQVDHRAVVLHPVEKPFEKERRQWDPVPWVEEDLLPPRSKGSARKKAARLALAAKEAAAGEGVALSAAEETVDEDPVPEHTIDVWPRKISLTPGSPGVDEYVPEPERMMFGIVTTVQRAKVIGSTLWTHFMLPKHDDEGTPNCLVLLDAKEDPQDVRELKDLFEAKGLPCGVRTGKYDRYEVRVLSMVKEMREYADDIGKRIDWFVFGDDDTFWVDMRSLRRLLSKYNSDEDWFIGATTEAQKQLEQFGRMAFGGAGMLVSHALLAKMYAIWDDCFHRYSSAFGGDEMQTRCAALATGRTKQDVTTEERGMHQFDIPGDSTGLFQGGIPVISMHHFLASGWIHLFGYGTVHTEIEQISRVRDAASFLGGDNLFSRHVFGDGKWLLVHGYSLTYFEEKLKREDMALMEHTWYSDYPLSFEDRPHIPERHPDGGKKTPAKQTFYIESTEVLSANSALFTFLQADSWDEHLALKDRVRLQVLWDGDASHRSTQRHPDAAALS
ncbi:hypothetical protein JCM8547_006224 [Rhodosporidiobolus lusitaniae]